MSIEHGKSERESLSEGCLRFFEGSKQRLGEFYIENEAERERFYNFIHPEIVLGLDQKGAAIPTITYTNKASGLRVNIEPDSIFIEAERLSDQSETLPIDTAKLLVGAGVARGLIAWKTLPIHSSEEDRRRLDIQEMLHEKDAMYAAVDMIDPADSAELISSIDRLGDSELIRINSLRFAVGISMQHVSDAIELQQSIAELMQPELIADQRQRSVDLKMALAMMDTIQGAFDFYDDTVNHMLFALSFPATPAEITRLMAGHQTQ